MRNTIRRVRRSITIRPDIWNAVLDYQFEQMIPSASAALERLVRIALRVVHRRHKGGAFRDR